MSILTLSSAYGRDYKSAAAVKLDWQAGKDFRIESMGRDCGRYVNSAQLPELKAEGVHALNIRFSSNRKVVVITL